jgi:hypothetical protein
VYLLGTAGERESDPLGLAGGGKPQSLYKSLVAFVNEVTLTPSLEEDDNQEMMVDGEEEEKK